MKRGSLIIIVILILLAITLTACEYYDTETQGRMAAESELLAEEEGITDREAKNIVGQALRTSKMRGSKSISVTDCIETESGVLVTYTIHGKEKQKERINKKNDIYSCVDNPRGFAKDKIPPPTPPDDDEPPGNFTNQTNQTQPLINDTLPFPPMNDTNQTNTTVPPPTNETAGNQTNETAPPNLSSCTDTDGLDYYTNGSVTYTSTSGFTNVHYDICRWDYCDTPNVNTEACREVEPDNVREYSCMDYGYTYSEFTCPNGCANGACLPVNDTLPQRFSISTSPNSYSPAQPSDFGNGNADLYSANTEQIYVSYYSAAQDHLGLARSSNAGQFWENWNGEIVVDNVSDVGRRNAITGINRDILYIAYLDGGSVTTGTTPYLKFARSEDSGESWFTTYVEDGSFGLGSSEIVGALDIGVWEPRRVIFIAFSNEDEQPPNYDADLMLASSSDGGVTWSVETIDAEGNVVSPTLEVISASDVMVAYRTTPTGTGQSGGDIMFAKQSADGSGWDTTLVDNGGSMPDMKVISETVMVSYFGEENQDLKFAKSTDAGATWSTQIIDGEGFVGRNAQIDATDENNIFIIYFDDTTENRTMKIATSINGGDVWDTYNVFTRLSLHRPKELQAINENLLHILSKSNNLRFTILER